jgi:DNA-binding transcriptional regulator GbsR (MarR family)
MELDKAKQKFIQSWGTLGSSWGINRTMAQIHALLLVSTEAMSTKDIMDQLQISRGNTNMNVRTLIEWGIVFKEFKVGERKEFFIADKDIPSVARQITRERSKRELEPLKKVLIELKNIEGNDSETKEFKTLVKDIDGFTNTVDSLLDKFIKSDEHWFYKTLFKVVKQ